MYLYKHTHHIWITYDHLLYIYIYRERDTDIYNIYIYIYIYIYVYYTYVNCKSVCIIDDMDIFIYFKQLLSFLCLLIRLITQQSIFDIVKTFENKIKL